MDEDTALATISLIFLLIAGMMCFVVSWIRRRDENEFIDIV